MKKYKTKISEKPFQFFGYTVDEFVRWCELNNLASYKSSSKKEFFKRINKGIIEKKDNKLFENGKEVQ